VLITTGSQQGLDLVAKILIDTGSRILVETPTYLGALQAFMPMEPEGRQRVQRRRRHRRRDLAAKAAPARTAPASSTCCRISRTRPAAP
jgi:2-aminoadipate transaminase